MMNRAKERLEKWGVKDHEPASLTIALPILRGAADESREELQDLWARLLAATMDPSRVTGIRQGFAEAIAKMDPPDALLLVYFNTVPNVPYGARDTVARELGLSTDEVLISIDNLLRVGLIAKPNSSNLLLSSLGREFLRVVTD
jgi:hypothetical protein